jgi:hypothetical protein
VGAFLKANFNRGFLNRDEGRGIHEVPEKMTRTGTLISVFNLEGQKSIEAAGHQRELEITVNLHGHGRGQGIHMEKVNAIGDPIFNDHALRVATHQLGGGAAELIGQQEGGFLMTKIRDDDLTKGTLIPAEGDGLI